MRLSWRAAYISARARGSIQQARLDGFALRQLVSTGIEAIAKDAAAAADV
jgi:hypothetical protein